MLEDQVWPKRAGHVRNKEIIDMEEVCVCVCVVQLHTHTHTAALTNPLP